MRRFISVTVLFVSLLTTVYSQNIRYVKPLSSGTGDGSSWTNASNDLQLMINNSNSGDTLWVAEGTYLPIRPANNLTIIDSNNRNNAFVVKKDIIILGGFPNTGVATLDKRDWKLYSSILSGDIGIAGDSTDNCCHVVISAGEVGTACLDGFTVTKGNADGTNAINVNTYNVSRMSGGGIITVSSSPVWRNLYIVNNHAASYGGGICITSGLVNTSNVLLTNITIIENNAMYGGGISAIRSVSALRDMTIINNNANNSGGGIYNEDSYIDLINIIIAKNTTMGNGGGIENKGTSRPLLFNTLITENHAEDGGGISAANSLIMLWNVTICNNTVSNTGGAIYSNSNTSYIYNSIIWGNKDTLSTENNITENTSNPSTFIFGNSLIGGMPVGNGVILNQDPLFVDAANGNYRLSFCSPAINIGDNMLIPQLTTKIDLDGNPRIHSGTVDLGAYEFRLVSVNFGDTTVLNKGITICHGDTLTISLTFSGTAPWELIYTKDKETSYDTIHSISQRLFEWELNPLETTTYQFIRLQDKNCAHIFRDSIHIKVLPKPVFSNSFSDDTLCNGEKTKAIIFSGDITHFQWEASGDTIEGIPTGIQIKDFGEYPVKNKGNTPLTTHITAIPVYSANETSCTGSDTSFTITILPEPLQTTVVQNDTLCDGAKTKAISFAGATHYQWQNTGTSITGIPAGIQNGDFKSYRVENKTTYPQQANIKVTPLYKLGTKTCTGKEDNFKIVIHPQTQILSLTRNKSIFCEDEQLELLVNATGGELTYQWYLNNDILTGANNNRYITSAVSREGKDVYYVEVSGRCGTEKSKHINIIVRSDKMLVEKWDDVILVDNSTNEYIAYQWYKNGVVIPGATNQFYQESGGLNGCYSVELTLTNGQKEHSCERCVEKATKVLFAYPNPVHQGEDINIVSEETPSIIQIYTVEGKLLKEVFSTNTVSTSGLQHGIYVLIINEKEEKHVLRCVVY